MVQRPDSVFPQILCNVPRLFIILCQCLQYTQFKHL